MPKVDWAQGKGADHAARLISNYETLRSTGPFGLGLSMVEIKEQVQGGSFDGAYTTVNFQPKFCEEFSKELDICIRFLRKKKRFLHRSMGSRTLH